MSHAALLETRNEIHHKNASSEHKRSHDEGPDWQEGVAGDSVTRSATATNACTEDDHETAKNKLPYVPDDC